MPNVNSNFLLFRFSLRSYSRHSADDSHHMPSLLRAAASLLRRDLVAALRACGVNNLVTCNVALRDPDNGEIYTNYKAVNIIAIIAAADMQRSEASINSNGPPLIDVDFDRLVLDERKARGQLLFRLAETTNGIMIHEYVRDYLLKKQFNDLAFYDLETVAL